MSKKMIIKGVGQFLAKRASKDGNGVEVITLGNMQDLKIDMNVEMEDIFGGDGLFAIDTLVKSKSIEITATDAKFDLAALELMMGSKLQEQKSDYVYVLGEQKAIKAGSLDRSASTGDAGVCEVDFGGTLFNGGGFAVRLKNSNRLLKQVSLSTSAAPKADEFMVDTFKDGSEDKARLIFSPALLNEDVVFNYQRTEIVDVVDILMDEVPFPVHVVHHGSFLQKDGTYAGIETELFSCMAKGSFSIDAARSTASTSAISLSVIDPERADGKLGSVKRFVSNKKV
ncbi:hypothetical protein HPY28_13375 [Brevibacillus sp. HB1.2]|uniref:hypothetical protein n=1 Tax=Brevibacillus TaxID=55080 RepID=UPI000372AB60|nr:MULTISPECIES: hypothetical protein [unclassified Brevibacillus]ATF11159.1 hypothetical protein A616_03795 [Brevibacillus brevis X23]NRS17019.1 hypothetical protein [Brevibacillus sp. HB1.4B]NTU21313.1 hypothetical protein [Brevibacillus sp. HB1.2]NTU30593.1 hypothetical protein [Brevibacillus sp. HB1.1]